MKILLSEVEFDGCLTPEHRRRVGLPGSRAAGLDGVIGQLSTFCPSRGQLANYPIISDNYPHLGRTMRCSPRNKSVMTDCICLTSSWIMEHGDTKRNCELSLPLRHHTVQCWIQIEAESYHQWFTFLHVSIGHAKLTQKVNPKEQPSFT